MSKERELLGRVLESRTFMQGVALRREIENYLAQPEHIPDVGNMVTQEPVYWENEKKALLNEIDHLTNRLAQPEQKLMTTRAIIQACPDHYCDMEKEAFKVGIKWYEKYVARIGVYSNE